MNYFKEIENGKEDVCDYATCIYCGCSGMIKSKLNGRYYCEECEHSQAEPDPDDERNL